MDKATPEAVASAILDGIESGATDIFPDAFADGFAQQFQASPKASEEQSGGDDLSSLIPVKGQNAGCLSLSKWQRESSTPSPSRAGGW